MSKWSISKVKKIRWVVHSFAATVHIKMFRHHAFPYTLVGLKSQSQFGKSEFITFLFIILGDENEIKSPNFCLYKQLNHDYFYHMHFL